MLGATNTDVREDGQSGPVDHSDGNIQSGSASSSSSVSSNSVQHRPPNANQTWQSVFWDMDEGTPIGNVANLVSSLVQAHDSVLSKRESDNKSSCITSQLFQRSATKTTSSSNNPPTCIGSDFHQIKLFFEMNVVMNGDTPRGEDCHCESQFLCNEVFMNHRVKDLEIDDQKDNFNNISMGPVSLEI